MGFAFFGSQPWDKSFGSLPSEAVDNALTTSLEITFADSDSPYALSVTAPVSPGRELTLAFLELLPLLLLLIVLLASLGAFLCSRVLARPRPGAAPAPPCGLCLPILQLD